SLGPTPGAGPGRGGRGGKGVRRQELGPPRQRYRGSQSSLPSAGRREPPYADKLLHWFNALILLQCSFGQQCRGPGADLANVDPASRTPAMSKTAWRDGDHDSVSPQAGRGHHIASERTRFVLAAGREAKLGAREAPRFSRAPTKVRTAELGG